MTDRTGLKLTDERRILFDKPTRIVAGDPSDDPPRSDVIDAALTHLIQSHENLENVRDKYSVPTVKDSCNTSVVGLRYRTSIDPKCR